MCQLKVFCFVFLFSVLSASGIIAQQFTGRVTFSDGEPIASASVVFRDNMQPSRRVAATTDNMGNYSVKFKSAEATDLQYAYALVDRPSKTFNFEVALREQTTLKIALIDLLGRQTVEIYSQSTKAGVHHFTWNYESHIHHLDNRIYLVTFSTSSVNKSVKFVQNSVNRLDFYAEQSAVSDFDSNGSPDYTYTATIAGNGFKTHVIPHLKADNAVQNFIVDRDVWVPFKCGSTFIGQYKGDRYEPFYIKGINLGAAIPGTSPAEMAPSAEMYARWFKLMSEAGYNLIRIYTLHYPRFYQELKKYNEANPATPLYLMHGAWLDEEYEGFEGQADLYTNHIWFVRDVNVSTEMESQPITEYFDNRVKEVIDVVHGNAVLPERWGWAAGRYTADVSPWVLGYIIGREIYANEVYYTNLLNPHITSYQGEVFSLAHGSASEVWATERLDKAMAYEKQKYRQQHPISFSSWPTLDPIDHPTEHGPEDMVSLNLDEIDETHAPGGYFASYHVYPYFPDFMVCDPDYRQYSDYMGENSYLGYLHDLKSKYANRPLIISEYGVSSSWGASRLSSNGMHHGGLTEKEQGEYIVRMMHNIRDANCGGGILFSWIDEWFKYVWIFGQNTHPETRNRWHNIYSAEENYGLISFVPEEADFSKFGYSSNAEKIDQVRMAADIEGLYVKVRLNQLLTNQDTLWLAIDTYNSGKGESILPNNIRVRNRAEFCVQITTSEALLHVTKAYDMFGIGQEGFPKSGQFFRSTATDGAGWNQVRWKNHRDEDFCGGSIFEAGELRIRNNKEPLRSDAVIFDKREVTVKLPWAMINFNDPSQMKVAHITDYLLHGGANYNQTEQSDGIAVTAFWGNSRVSTPRFVWPAWNEYSMPVTREYKKSSYFLVKEALKEFPVYVNE
jgi:hypothetical protein